jgi:xanthine dehydrogenase molybdopterin-binding subunit B
MASLDSSNLWLVLSYVSSYKVLIYISLILSHCATADKHFMQVKLSSQYYFYMETQTALAVPDEDNCMVVYSSSQCPEAVQNTIAQCLGLPCHNVRVITRRVGGGFGGKAVRSLPVRIGSIITYSL